MNELEKIRKDMGTRSCQNHRYTKLSTCAFMHTHARAHRYTHRQDMAQSPTHMQTSRRYCTEPLTPFHTHARMHTQGCTHPTAQPRPTYTERPTGPDPLPHLSHAHPQSTGMAHTHPHAVWPPQGSSSTSIHMLPWLPPDCSDPTSSEGCLGHPPAEPPTLLYSFSSPRLGAFSSSH